MYAGEVIGEYTIIWAGQVTIRYRYTNGNENWKLRIGRFYEWMEMDGHFRKRCRGNNGTN